MTATLDTALDHIQHTLADLSFLGMAPDHDGGRGATFCAHFAPDGPRMSVQEGGLKSAHLHMHEAALAAVLHARLGPALHIWATHTPIFWATHPDFPPSPFPGPLLTLRTTPQGLSQAFVRAAAHKQAKGTATIEQAFVVREQPDHSAPVAELIVARLRALSGIRAPFALYADDPNPFASHKNVILASRRQDATLWQHRPRPECLSPYSV